MDGEGCLREFEEKICRRLLICILAEYLQEDVGKDNSLPRWLFPKLSQNLKYIKRLGTNLCLTSKKQVEYIQEFVVLTYDSFKDDRIFSCKRQLFAPEL